MSVVIPSLRAAIAVPPWVKNELWRNARAVPSLDLRFADNKSLTDAVTGASLVTFTRASSGTFVGSDGLLQTAVTNLLLRSEEFNDAAFWSLLRLRPFGSGSTANIIPAPNETLTADYIEQISTSTVAGAVFRSLTQTGGTFSIFAKAGEKSFIELLTDNAAGNSTWFNLSNGTVGTIGANHTASIAPAGNNWYRCSVTFTNTIAYAAVYLADTNNSRVVTNSGGVYIWGAQLETGSAATAYIPTTSTINSAPRFDHNPTTGESLGLLVEEQRTNSVTNNTMVGAVAGTPGTLPTGFGTFVSPTGLTRTVVGSGTVNGISYIDVRFNGTPSSTGEISLYLSPATTATLAQAWTATVYLSIAGGSTSNIGAIKLRNFELNSFTYVRETGTNFISSISSNLIRRQNTTTSFGASANQVQLALSLFAAAGGTPIDITIRIGLPQLEQGAFATSPILTSTAAATRSADVASITGSAFTGFYRQDEGSFFCSTFAPKGVVVYGTGDTFADTQYVTTSLSNNVSIRSGGADVAVLTAPVSTTTLTNIAHGYAANNFAAVSNGGAISTDTSGAVPLAQVRLKFGSSAWAVGSGNEINGYIRRLCYWPARLSNATLQTLTQ